MNRIPLFILCTLFAQVAHANFSNHVRVYQGDFNGDSRTDFYVQQRELVILHGDVATPISTPSSIADFVLVQASTGDFSIVSSLTSAEQNAVKAWPSSSAELYVEDLNVDGRFDLMLKDLSNVASLANDNLDDDQIVFSPTGSNLVPAVTRRVDPEFSDFMTDLLVYQVQGLEYYFNASTYVGEQCISGFYYPIYIQVWDPYLDQYVHVFVGWDLVCTEATSVYDLSDFSQDAIDAIIKAYEVYDGVGSSTMADIVDIFEQIFGVQIGIPGVPDCDDSFVAFPNAQDCTDNETLLDVVIRFANSEETEPSPGAVEFRARSVAFGRGGWWHASVHYGNTWYSAFPEHGPRQAAIGNGGKLEKDVERFSDDRRETIQAATAYSPILSPAAMWNLVSVSYAAYSNNLDYCLYPELGLTGAFVASEWPSTIIPGVNPPNYVPCDGYNSNSFAKGILDSVGAVLIPTPQHVEHNSPIGPFVWEFELTTHKSFPGITKPVPPSEFQ
jgi:hypothetical protein